MAAAALSKKHQSKIERCPIAREQVARAVASLCRHEEAARAKREAPQDLTADADEFVYLSVSLVKMPERNMARPANIALPAPLRDAATTDVCVFVKTAADRERVKEEARTTGVQCRLKVIDVPKLKSDYKQYEAKRKLAGSYDLFLVDRRIYPLMPGLLGKTFFAKNKMPVVVEFAKNVTVKSLVDEAVTGTQLRLKRGSSVTLKVARFSFEQRSIVDNVIAAAAGVALKVESGWANVKSVLIKSAKSLALPIYCKAVRGPQTINPNAKSGAAAAEVAAAPQQTRSQVAKRKAIARQLCPATETKKQASETKSKKAGKPKRPHKGSKKAKAAAAAAATTKDTTA
eukprot:m51a1_g3157 putative ribosomal L1 domain-containing protein (344) ;mRNA; f:352335-353439